MKNIIIPIIAVFTLCSCQKKHTYNCYTINEPTDNSILISPNNLTVLDMSEKKMERYVEKHNIDKDGDPSTWTMEGEEITECIKVQ